MYIQMTHSFKILISLEILLIKVPKPYVLYT